MSDSPHFSSPLTRLLPWDARLARSLVQPLKDSPVSPNHLTTVRLATGLAAAAAFLPGTYGWSNVAALLAVASNFLDHADGELARISGKSSRFGHVYDLACDAAVTVLLFVAMGAGAGARTKLVWEVPPAILGTIAGSTIVWIFFLRIRMESMGGKAVTRQAALGGFETEDVLYLLPLVTLCNGVRPLLFAASIGAPLYALWVAVEYRRVLRRYRVTAQSTSDADLA